MFRVRVDTLAIAIALAGLGLGCEREPPPGRPQRLSAPPWSANGAAPVTTPIPDAAPKEATPSPSPNPTPRYEGVMATATQTWEQTLNPLRRRRAIEDAFKALTAQDLEEANRAVNSGRRPDAEVAMALLTLHYAALGEWSLLEDAFRRLFRAVPALAAEPEYRLEHALSLLKLERFQDSLDAAALADRQFRELPQGEETLSFRVRLAECRAWATEGLAREAATRSLADAEILRLDRRAVTAWETTLSLLAQLPPETPGLAERLGTARDHVQFLREAIDLSRGEERP